MTALFIICGAVYAGGLLFAFCLCQAAGRQEEMARRAFGKRERS